MEQSGVGSMQGSNEDRLPMKGHTRGGYAPTVFPVNEELLRWTVTVPVNNFIQKKKTVSSFSFLGGKIRVHSFSVIDLLRVWISLIFRPWWSHQICLFPTCVPSLINERGYTTFYYVTQAGVALGQAQLYQRLDFN